MTNVLLVYTTDLGSTRTMAEAVASGVCSVPNTELQMFELRSGEEVKLDHVRWCDALIMGSPVRHRNMQHRVKMFIESVLEAIWLTDEMVGKVGGVFTVGGGHGNVGAGCEIAQLGMLAAMAANGMLLVSFPKCTPGADSACLHWGPSGRTGGKKMEPQPLTAEMLEAAKHHGANITRVAAVLKEHKDLLARGNVAPTPELLEQFINAD